MYSKARADCQLYNAKECLWICYQTWASLTSSSLISVPCNSCEDLPHLIKRPLQKPWHKNPITHTGYSWKGSCSLLGNVSGLKIKKNKTKLDNAVCFSFENISQCFLLYSSLFSWKVCFVLFCLLLFIYLFFCPVQMLI